MGKYRVVGIREETSAEKARREWFEKQMFESPSNLEEAARLIIGLVTGLLTVLFGVLAVASDPLPAYLRNPNMRALGIITIISLLLALVAALYAVLPWKWTLNPADLLNEETTFAQILQHKSRALTASVVVFGIGLIALGAALVAAMAAT